MHSFLTKTPNHANQNSQGTPPALGQVLENKNARMVYSMVLCCPIHFITLFTLLCTLQRSSVSFRRKEEIHILSQDVGETKMTLVFPNHYSFISPTQDYFICTTFCLSFYRLALGSCWVITTWTHHMYLVIRKQPPKTPHSGAKPQSNHTQALHNTCSVLISTKAPWRALNRCVLQACPGFIEAA